MLKITKDNLSLLPSTLEARESFNYKSDIGEPILCRPRDKFYYAYRKVNGKLRQMYLGKCDSVDFEKLELVAETLNLNDFDYWQSKTKKPKHLTREEIVIKIQEIGAKIKSDESGYRKNSASSLIKDINDLISHLND